MLATFLKHPAFPTCLTLTWMFLVYRQYKKRRLTTITLCLTILALLTSTTVYVTTTIFKCHSYFLQTLVTATTGLWNYRPQVVLTSVHGEPSDVELDSALPLVEACTSAAALTFNASLF